MFKPRDCVTTDKFLNTRSVDDMRRITQEVGFETKIPDPQTPFHEYKPRARGLKTGMGVNEFWCFLFERNELVGKKEKMTDAAIRQAVLEEFPDRFPRLRAGTQTVQSKRVEYMQGKLSSRPRFWSNRYDEEGNIYVLRRTRAVSLLVTPDDTPNNEAARVVRDRRAGILAEYMIQTRDPECQD